MVYIIFKVSHLPLINSLLGYVTLMHLKKFGLWRMKMVFHNTEFPSSSPWPQLDYFLITSFKCRLLFPRYSNISSEINHLRMGFQRIGAHGQISGLFKITLKTSYEQILVSIIKVLWPRQPNLLSLFTSHNWKLH